MSLTRIQARDEINALLKAAADTITDFIMMWDDVEADSPGGTHPTLPYAKVFIRHQTGTQGSLSNRVGSRIFERSGLVTIQVFTPSGDGLTDSDSYATILANAIEGISTANGVWFRNVRIQEVGNDGAGKYLTNITAEFEYTEVR